MEMMNKACRSISSKGFIHVLEAILVALIIIVTVPLLLIPSERPTSWEVARLTATGEDVLATLDGIGYGEDSESFAEDILEENASVVDAQIRKVLGTTSIGYGIRTRGSIKNEIRVGCNCTRQQRNVLEQSLTPARVNDRKVVFRVFPFDLDRLSRLDFDVIILNNSAAVDRMANFYDSSRGNRELVLNHLRKGHGIVEITDLSSTDIDEPLQQEVFGLSSGSGTGGDITFTNTNNSSRINYDMNKYFYGVGSDLNFTGTGTATLTLRTLDHDVRKNTDDGVWDSVDIDLNRNGSFEGEELDIGEGETFTVDLNGIERDLEVGYVEVPAEVVHFNYMREPDYPFHDFVGGDPAGVAPIDGDNNRIVASSDGGRNAVIVREVEGGRTAWVSNGEGDDFRGMVKSAIIWAAGEDWAILPRSVTGRQVKVSYYVEQGEEFFEPYWIEMTLWFLF